MPTRTRRWLVFAAALAFLSPGISRAQEDQALTGRVVDTEGSPVPGVEIWRPTEGSESLVAAVSGPDGLFEIPADGFFPLSACPPGWLPDNSPSQRSSDPEVFEIRLRPATRIAGRVVDGQGEPVAGVHVEARLAGKVMGCAIYIEAPCPGASYFRTGTTDAEGRFAFESLEPGWYEVRAFDGLPKVARRLGEAGAGAREIEFVVPERLASLEGRVVDADGEPVSGARVSVSGARPSTEVLTDGAGRYRVPRVVPGPQRFEVRHPDVGRIAERIQIEGPRVRFDVRMPPATVVQGRVLGRDGSALAGARLEVDDEPVELDAEGRFRLSLSPGEHVIHAEAPERAPMERRLTAEGEPIDLDFELGRPAAILGCIAGIPRGQFVSVELREHPVSARNTLDGHGRFQISDVGPGTWTLVATDSFGRTLERRVDVDEGRQIRLEDLRFPPLPEARGRVLDPEGGAVPNATLTFEQEESRVWAMTDAEGRFAAHLVDGTWTVKAERRGFGPAAATFTLAGASIDTPDLRLVPAVTVSGYLRGLAPGEVPFLHAATEDGTWTRGAPAKQDGSFQLPDLWPGNWIFTISLDGRESSTRVRLLPGNREVRIDLVFEGDS